MNQVDDKDELPYLDCGITDWNLRPRKIEGEKYLKTIEIYTLPFKLVKKLSPEEQATYKYIVHIDGHVSAFRLSLELRMGSLILIVDSIYNMWYKNLLKPYVHYVPVKKDLSDIIEKVKWCKANDKKCEEIAKNAKKFYEEYLSKEDIFDYLKGLIVNLRKVGGDYDYRELPLAKQLRKEKEWFLTLQKSREVPVFGFPIIGGNRDRDYHKYKAVSKFMFEHKLSFREMISKNKLSTITLCEVSGTEFIVKSSKDEKKMNENIHEAYIAMNEINHLLKHIPNFVFVFNALKFEDGVSVVLEKIEGVNMLDWLKSDDFNFEDFKLILAQLCLALQVAQKACSFVHYDLYPWNVMIQKLDEEKDIEYVVNSEKVVRIHTNIIPVIIDYGKTRVIHNNEHFGFINMFKFSKIHDLMTIVFSSILQICEKGFNDNLKETLKIINFFTGNKCFAKRITSEKQLNHFVTENSSFTKTISLEKFDLEDVKLDNFLEILNLNKKKVFITKRRMKKVARRIISTKQYYDFIVNASSGDRKYGVKSFSRFDEKIYVYYYFQQLNNRKYIRNFRDMLKDSKIIENKYFSLKEKRKSLNLRDDFVDGEKMEVDNDKNYNYLDLDIIDMILTYSGDFEVSEEDREILLREINGVHLSPNREHSADINILRGVDDN